MSFPLPKPRFKWILCVIFLGVITAGWYFQEKWLPQAQQWAGLDSADSLPELPEEDDHAGHDHGHDDDGHDDHGHDDHEGHDHAAHDESTSLELTEQARSNIGLTGDNVREIELSTFTRTITVPAVVKVRPGLSLKKIVTPMTGIVTEIKIVEGEALNPDSAMFKIRLTHEELVQAQTAFLKTLGDLDIQGLEIDRLQKLSTKGAIAGKLLLKEQYTQKKLAASLKANREALLLHGLSALQVDEIVSSRRLISEHQVRAPSVIKPSDQLQLSKSPISPVAGSQDNASVQNSYVVEKLDINVGDFVQAGNTLCVMSDFSGLYIQGRAFEHDSEEITRALKNKWNVTAVREDNQDKSQLIEGLELVYLDNRVDPDSRALYFYVNLPNEIMNDSKTPDGHRFLTWRYKPGQRMQLLVPVEQWEEELVVPVDAVAQEGAEYYIFQENGNHFDRIPVHLKYQDQFTAVISNDGSIFPGDIIAFTGAHQLQMAIKNKSGGAVDPHAGHNH